MDCLCGGRTGDQQHFRGCPLYVPGFDLGRPLIVGPNEMALGHGVPMYRLDEDELPDAPPDHAEKFNADQLRFDAIPMSAALPSVRASGRCEVASLGQPMGSLIHG